MYKCSECKQIFSTFPEMGKHAALIHIYCKVDFEKKCPRCQKTFQVVRTLNKKTGKIFSNKDEKLYCSRKCANSRKHSEETKLKIGRSAKKNANPWNKGKNTSIKYCTVCNKEISRYSKTTLCRKCFNLKNVKEFILKGGRVCIRAPKGYKGKLYDGIYILRSRYVMEQHLGRLLMGNEIVHHKDKNKTHDAIENLELTTQQEHSRGHMLEKGTAMIELACTTCGKYFSRTVRKHKANLKKGQVNTFCTKECAHASLRK